MKVSFHSAAETEHLGHVSYYENARAGLGDQYLRDFETTLNRIAEGPHRHKIERPPNIRVVSLLSFPYFVIYRDLPDSVQVLAVPHFRQRPGYWQSRL